MHTSMLTAVVVCVLAHRALRTREKKKKILFFFFSSNNANDDTTFTSNWLLGSIFLFSRFFFLTHEARENEKEKERAPLTGLPVHVANIHETNAARAAKKKQEKKRALFPVLSYCSAVVCA